MEHDNILSQTLWGEDMFAERYLPEKNGIRLFFYRTFVE
jgi:hypothetical protein